MISYRTFLELLGFHLVGLGGIVIPGEVASERLRLDTGDALLGVNTDEGVRFRIKLLFQRDNDTLK